jgi:hypothetical protein
MLKISRFGDIPDKSLSPTIEGEEDLRALPGLGVLIPSSCPTDVAAVDLLDTENREVSIVDDRLTTDRDFLLPIVDSWREETVLLPNRFLEILSRFMAEGRNRYA